MPPPKHIDINYRENNEPWRFTKAYFPDNSFFAASGQKYALGKYVTRGGNGTVFQCFGPDRIMRAVKFLHQMDEQRMARFDFETQVLSDLQHDRVLHCHDVGNVETTHKWEVPFMITELFDGNLQGAIENDGPYKPVHIRDIAIELAEALEYIHARGVIHRDLKPANVFIARDGGVVLGDFGIAKTTTDSGAERYSRYDFTMNSEFVGPVLWLSPELAAYAHDKSRPVDHRSDLFQLGLIIWYLLVGTIPRGGLDVEDDPTGGRMFEIVQRLTKQNPERRYPDATALISDLKVVAL